MPECVSSLGFCYVMGRSLLWFLLRAICAEIGEISEKDELTRGSLEGTQFPNSKISCDHLPSSFHLSVNVSLFTHGSTHGPGLSSKLSMGSG